MEVSRSLPAAGQVTLLWVISGVNQHDPTLGFNQTEGVILFLEVRERAFTFIIPKLQVVVHSVFALSFIMYLVNVCGSSFELFSSRIAKNHIE